MSAEQSLESLLKMLSESKLKVDSANEQVIKLSQLRTQQERALTILYGLEKERRLIEQVTQMLSKNQIAEAICIFEKRSHHSETEQERLPLQRLETLKTLLQESLEKEIRDVLYLKAERSFLVAQPPTNKPWAMAGPGLKDKILPEAIENIRLAIRHGPLITRSQYLMLLARCAQIVGLPIGGIYGRPNLVPDVLEIITTVEQPVVKKLHTQAMYCDGTLVGTTGHQSSYVPSLSFPLLESFAPSPPAPPPHPKELELALSSRNQSEYIRACTWSVVRPELQFPQYVFGHTTIPPSVTDPETGSAPLFASLLRHACCRLLCCLENHRAFLSAWSILNSDDLALPLTALVAKEVTEAVSALISRYASGGMSVTRAGQGFAFTGSRMFQFSWLKGEEQRHTPPSVLEPSVFNLLYTEPALMAFAQLLEQMPGASDASKEFRSELSHLITMSLGVELDARFTAAIASALREDGIGATGHHVVSYANTAVNGLLANSSSAAADELAEQQDDTEDRLLPWSSGVRQLTRDLLSVMQALPTFAGVVANTLLSSHQHVAAHLEMTFSQAAADLHSHTLASRPEVLAALKGTDLWRSIHEPCPRGALDQFDRRLEALGLEQELIEQGGLRKIQICTDSRRFGQLATIHNTAEMLSQELGQAMPLAARLAAGPAPSSPSRRLSVEGWRMAAGKGPAEELQALQRRLQSLAHLSLATALIELRVQAVVWLDGMRSCSYRLDFPPQDEPEAYVVRISSMASNFAERIGPLLPGSKMRLLFNHLPMLLRRILLSIADGVEFMNELGSQKLLQDVFALQQSMATLLSDFNADCTMMVRSLDVSDQIQTRIIKK
eukprot:gnl/Dysnectes_brevis/4857_a6729_734.p1 GENE.gnl/Dysnectes_brevis/4857_a6729_734~~gnl/Dysnectes_brevis/4857_a6729_734.p1  ORF type:complete len:954 (+),score=157.99 gnl/Dysnectes_brevis/4857_a6729_734:343-2862(+)